MRYIAAILLFACLPGVAAAQKVELRSDEVLLDLVVTDSKGHALLDLKPGEVEVYENGKRQDVTSFGLVSTATPDGAAAPGGPAPLSTSPFRRVNLVMIVVDRTSVQHGNLKAVRDAAAEFVDKRLEPTDLVAVFAIANRPVMVQNFTNDRAHIAEAITRATTGVDGPLIPVLTATGDARDTRIYDSQSKVNDTSEPRSKLPDLADALNKLGQQADAALAYVTEQVQARALVQGLFWLLRTYGSIPDRKSVVLYSEGMAVDSATASQLSSLISLANRTGFAFYTVDAAGMRTGPGANVASSEPVPVGIQNDVRRDRSIVSGGNSEIGRAERELRSASNGALNRIAGETGGIFVKNTNDLGKGLERLAGDLHAYYALTYAPADATPDGTFRSIEVKVARKDAKVRTRSGYYAVPGGPESILLPFEQPVLAVLNAPADKRPADLRAGVRAEHFAADEGWLVPVVVGVAGEGLDPLPRPKDAAADGPLQFEVDTVALVRDESRAVVAKLSRRTIFGVELARVEQFRKTVFTLQPFPDRVVLGPGRYTVTVAVYDPTSKKAAVVEREISLGEAPTENAPALSSVVVGRGATKTESGAPADPFVVPGGMRVEPSPDGRLSKARGDRLIPYFRLYGKVGAEYRVKIDFVRDGKTMVSSGELPLTIDSTGEAAVARAFDLASFQPGAYAARVTVTPPGAAPITTATDFVVEP